MLLLTKVVIALMASFLISVILGLIIIPALKSVNFGQKISEYVGLSHRKKEGTPTMGGLIFIIATLITVLILVLTKKIVFSYNLGICLAVFIGYAFIGFLDDYLSIKRGKNEGLTVAQKFLLQVVVAIIFFVIYMRYNGNTNFTVTTLGIDIDLGWGYGILILLLLVGFSNAVNLTDGLDGLSGGLSTIALIAFALIALFIGVEDMGIFCIVLIGSLLGFLMYNSYPAKIFMGDTGSLALGAVLATVAILTRREVTLFFVGFVFIVETLSVIVQIIYIKTKKKKLFLMTPLHHHFEKKGYQEPYIVKAFWLFGILGSLAGIIFALWI